MTFEVVALPDGLDWIMRPALRGLCKFESLNDGTLDLAQVVLLNDALDCQAENDWRAQDAAKRG